MHTKPKILGIDNPKYQVWSPWFAWRPVKTLDLRWVWLEEVERISFHSNQIPHAAQFGISWSIGATCYRLASS